MPPPDEAVNPPITPQRALELMEVEGEGLARLLEEAAALCRSSHGSCVTYSRKVFIPLTTLCRNECGYCTFRREPGGAGGRYLSPEEVLSIARLGAGQGCKEALFSLGDKPERRYPEARRELARLGYDSTADYLAAMSRLVLEESGLLPHLNPGTMGRGELAELREYSVSMGLMLENLSPRLRRAGMAHHGAPDKSPRRRLEVLRHGGELSIPFTTGLLIGIGETPRERVESLFAIKELHGRHGHIQEVIIQNFSPKSGTPMAGRPAPGLTDLLRTLAVARLVLGGEMNLQAPPNLTPGVYPRLLEAGINDWGGISPVTADHINPEAPWPEIGELARRSAQAGRRLRERLPLYPEYVTGRREFVPEAVRPFLSRLADEEGYAIQS